MSPMKRSLRVTATFACALLAAATRSWSADVTNNAALPHHAIPYVPTRHDTIRDLLWLADVGTNDVVYDLGSGDGRVVIAAVRDFGAKQAVGIEINPQLVQQSREKAVQAGVAARVQFINGDLFTNDFSPASVVVLYLGHGANLDLRPRLIRSLKPGTRIVSHQFGMGEWTPDKLLDVRTVYLGMYGTMFNEFKTNPDVPDFDGAGKRSSHDVLSEWIVPAPVAGVWRGKVRDESGDGELVLTLHQRLSGVSGSFEFAGLTNLSGYIQADLWGDHLRCWLIPTNQNSRYFQMWFEGHAANNTLAGSCWVRQGKDMSEVEWTGHRDKSDFTGTWEWAGPSNSPVQLKIERRDGQLAATYTDKNLESMSGDVNQPIPITDIYDFGGGFYFTILLGSENNGDVRRRGPEDGWLIGEAATHDNAISGTISFYPYQIWQSVTNQTVQNGPRDWQPKRLAP